MAWTHLPLPIDVSMTVSCLQNSASGLDTVHPGADPLAAHQKLHDDLKTCTPQEVGYSTMLTYITSKQYNRGWGKVWRWKSISLVRPSLLEISNWSLKNFSYMTLLFLKLKLFYAVWINNKASELYVLLFSKQCEPFVENNIYCGILHKVKPARHTARHVTHSKIRQF